MFVLEDNQFDPDLLRSFGVLLHERGVAELYTQMDG